MLNRNTTTRIWIIAIVLAVLSGGGFLLLQRAMSSEARPLRKSLALLPTAFSAGQWQGEDQQLDERVAVRVGARNSLSRVYTSSSDQSISLHIADWETLDEPTLPHPPAICYPANGATILWKEAVSVGSDDPIQAELLLIETTGRRSLVLYWYCWDEFACTTRWQAMVTRLKLLGRSDCPPVVKVLFEMPSSSSEQDKEELLTFANEVRNWTRGL